MRLTLLAATAAAFLAASFLAPVNAKTVLITGSNSGIGLEFAKQYAARGWDVVATHRRDTAPESLVALKSEYPDLVRIETMDVVNHAQIDALAAKLKGTPIDVLINNAGITGNFSDPTAPQSFGSLAYDQWEDFMRINALGPLKVSEAFAPHVKASEDKKILAVSSLAGSFGYQGPNIPGGYWYKSSKATLNMYMKNIANDLKSEGVIVAVLSPGTVRVEKVGDVDFPGLIEPEDSIAGMISVIDGLTIANSGAYYRYDGTPQPF